MRLTGRETRGRRAARWIGGIFGGLVALLALAIGGTYLGLQTAAGGRLLRNIAVKETNASIAGHLALAPIEFRGHAITVRDVVLSDPDGTPVVRVARVTVGYALGGLLHHRLLIKSIDIDRPQLDLREDARGLNLSRATAPRHPKPEKPPATSADWQVVLGRLGIVGAAISYESAAPGSRAIRCDDLSVAAAGRAHTATGDGSLRFALGGMLHGLPGSQGERIGVNAALEHSGADARGTADASIGRLLALAATMRSQHDVDIALGELRLPPALAAGLDPSWPVRVPLAMQATVRLRGDVVAAHLAAHGEGASGHLVVDGDATTDGRQTPSGIRVDVRDLRLSQLLGSSTPSPAIALLINVERGSLQPEHVTGEVRVDVPRTIIARYGYGPLHLDARAQAGQVEHLALSLPLPGASLTANGGTTGRRTDLTARLAVARLDTVRAALRALGQHVPPLAGEASLVVDARGTDVKVTRAGGWTVDVQANVPSVTVAAARYAGIALHASLTDLDRSRQSLTATASMQAPLPIAFALGATARETIVPPRDANHPRVDATLNRLAVRYPQGHWDTDRPAQLLFDGDVMAVHRLELRSGDQTLAVDADVDARQIDARVHVRSLQLGDLPRMDRMKVAGLLDASVHAHGSKDTPRVDARVGLRNGRYDRYRHLSADVTAALSEDRIVTGTLKAAAADLADIAARFRLPAAWPPGTDAPVALTLDLHDVQLGALPVPRVRADGVVGAHLDVQGTAGNPRLALKIQGSRLSVENGSAVEAGTAPLSFPTATVDVTYQAPHLKGEVALEDDHHGTLNASGETSIPAADLRDPAALDIQHRPIAGSLRMNGLDPEGIAALVPSLKVIEGRISGRFTLAGTIGDPQLGGEMSWRKGDVVLVKPPVPDNARKVARQ